MKKLIVANWKMQLDYRASLALAGRLEQKAKGATKEVVVCPDYLALPIVAAILQQSPIKMGAQDVAAVDQGPYTGEVSAVNLRKLGVKYVILGHSERREHQQESSALINAKIKMALAHKLVPILCVGENKNDRHQGQSKKVLGEELRRCLKGIKIKTSADLVVAYEPLWAVGSGHPLGSVEADAIGLFIKTQVMAILKKKIRVLYGGSVSVANAGEFLQQKNIDGLLVGGASLRAEEFNRIIHS